MASVAVQRIMTFEKPDHVHPFFRKPDDRPDTEESNRDNAPSTAQDGAVVEVEEKGTGKRKKTSKKNSNGTSANGSKQPSLLAFVGLEKAALPAESTESATANAGANSAIVEEEATLEEDPNYERRKRRKTVFPGQEEEEEEGHPAIDERSSTVEMEYIVEEPTSLPWHEQLLAEASKSEQESAALETDIPAITTSSNTNNGKTVSFVPSTSSQEPEVTWNTTSDPPVTASADAGIPGTAGVLFEEKVEQLVPAGGKLQADLPLLPVREDRATKPASPKTPPPAVSSRPVRMIQLKGGKLASPPKPKSKTEPEKVEGKRKTRGKGRQAKQWMVTINYGKYDDRTAFGDRINRILGGGERFEPETTHSDLPRTITTPKKASPKKPSGPPKITHPFFSGKPLQKPAQERGSVSKDATEDVVNMASPRKSSATTPGKIRAQAQAHRASLSVPVFGLTMGAPFRPRPKKASGTREAPWPWEGIVHARGAMDRVPVVDSDLAASKFHEGHIKRKQTTVVVRNSEDIIKQYSEGLKQNDGRSALRIPERLVTTGVQLQRLISGELNARLKFSEDGNSESEDDVVVRKQPLQHAPHPALSTMYAAIKAALTPFDKFECETQAWTQKYAPKCADEVLQPGKEALILRDWLKNSTISAVATSSNRSTTGSHVASTKPKAKPEKKKKRKRPEDLDDFLVSSEDDLAESAKLEELKNDATSSSRDPQKRSLVRGGGTGVRGAIKSCNAVLISGPHGCGKTAAVYAVAKELGFEVFELNSGSRRSGKDVLEKVGDMTENHLVQQVSKALSEKTDAMDEKPINIDIVQDDTPDVKQGSMTSFFKPAAQKKKTAVQKTPVPAAECATVNDEEAKKQQPRQEQKQSLILLEEVDVLFDEDKQFWLTVFALAAHSKRPIVMTCTNENLVPLESLALHAILRFIAPPVDLAVDYLLLTAAREGHLLERPAVKSLYKSNGNDIRASVTNLDFWCQIGVGDIAGGFNWMIDRYPPGVDVDEHGNTLRVVSKHTYTIGMGTVSQDLLRDSGPDGADKAEALLVMAWDEWQVGSDDLLSQTKNVHDGLRKSTSSSPKSELSFLQDFEFLADCTSAADMYCGLGMREVNEQPLDTTSPELSDKARLNYIVGFPWILVQADPTPDYTNIDTRLAITTQLLTHQIRSALHKNNNNSLHTLLDETPSKNIEESLITTIQTHRSSDHVSVPLTRVAFSHALDLLAEAPSSSLMAPTSMTASSFDREFSIIVKDIAPYVRGIAAHDLQIEQQRIKVSSLLSAGGGAKKMRMTRASRSAIEGGRRETTRKERWFDKALNLGLVLETGGDGWCNLVRAKSVDEEGSVRSTREGSVKSSSEHDITIGTSGTELERGLTSVTDVNTMEELTWMKPSF